MSCSIQKQLIISRGDKCQLDNLSRVRKYRFQLSFFQRKEEEYFSMNYKLFKDSLHGQQRKRITRTKFDYEFETNQGFRVKDVQRVSCMRRFNFSFEKYSDFDFYRCTLATNSQLTVHSDGKEDSEDSEDSENELDLEIQSSSTSFQQNQRNVKKIFKQCKRVNNLSLTFAKIDPSHYLAFQYLPLINTLESCQIKIKVRAPTDISELRDLLKKAKQRNYWPKIKSMVIYLRHSYNKENCTSRFIHFCRVLQEISEIIQDLHWIRIKLKVKYMWRLDKTAFFYLQEALQKAPNRYVKLSFITAQTMNLKTLFKIVREMNNLQKFSLRYNQLFGIKSFQSLEELTESLKKISSLKNLKINQTDLLDQKKNKDALFSSQKTLQNLGDLSQITSFHLNRQVGFIDKTLWGCFSNSISRLSNLQVLTFWIRIAPAEGVYPDSRGFIDFFAGFENLHNLRIFSFDYLYHSLNDYHQDFQRIDGSKIIKTLFQALKNLKELQNFHFRSPWISSPNSDVEEFTKILPSFQKLKRFSFHFQITKSLDPVDNSTFLKFAKVICCLPSIESLKVTFEMKEVSNLTYEAAMLLMNKFRRKEDWKLEFRSKQIDQQVSERLKMMLKSSVYICKN